jgi:3-oxoacyl-[acyl-carrier-protein] synthase II
MEDLIASRRPGFALPQTLTDRLTFLQTPSDLAVHAISHRHGLRTPPLTHVSACAAGTDAIGAAFRLIASGRRHWMLAGGSDSMINPLGVAGFCAVRATTTSNAFPARASRPFDRERSGFVLGEGAGLLVLETLDDARARGAQIAAEVVGYGNSFDAYGISEPHPDGRGAYQAMAAALADAGVDASVVDCINAHGTSTRKNDPVETAAIKRLLGPRAHAIRPATSTTSPTRPAATSSATSCPIPSASAGRMPPWCSRHSMNEPRMIYALTKSRRSVRRFKPASLSGFRNP